MMTNALPRLTPRERAHFREIGHVPAVGTVAQRLDVIRARFGPTKIVLTKIERAQLTQCQLAAVDPLAEVA